MRQVSLAGLDVSRLGLGCMDMSAFYSGAIPGTKRVARLEETVAADALVLTEAQVARLSAIGPPAGERYADMSAIGR